MIRKIILESSIDYKDKFGPVLFISGCNFNCPFCHNAMLNKSSGRFDEEKMLSELKLKTKKGWYTGVCISGGEPTIDESLPELVKKLKAIGLSVKLDTNGSNPEVLKKLLDENLIDYVAMDIKSNKELYSSFTGVSIDLNKIEESIKILGKLDAEMFEFRTTIAPIIEDGKARFMTPEEAEEMAKWISGLINRKDVYWFIQSFVSRDKEDMNDSRLSSGSIKEEFKETPKDLLIKIRDKIREYFPRAEIR